MSPKSPSGIDLLTAAQASVPSLDALLAYYLACVEEEDLKSLALKLSSHHRSFLCPWTEEEPLLHSSATEVSFRALDARDVQLLTRGALEAGDPQRFYYGYPLYLDSDDCIAPLFFIEVMVEQRAGTEFVLRPAEADSIQFNHHLLRRAHVQPEEIREVQEHLEGDSFGSFAARLKAAYDAIGEAPPPRTPTPSPLDALPTPGSPKNTWYNCPVLFRSERSNYTMHLRHELGALRRYPSFQQSAAGTALGALLQSDPGIPATQRNPQSVLTIRPLNKAQEDALQAALVNRLTVITGPPGTGKSQVVANLLANAAMSGKPVLFVSKNNKAVDVVRKWLKDSLGEDRDWTFRVGNYDEMKKTEEEMLARLDGLGQGQTPDSTRPAVSTELATCQSEIHRLMSEALKLSERVREYNRRATDERRIRMAVRSDWLSLEEVILPTSAKCDELGQLSAQANALATGRGLGFWLRLQKFLRGRRLLKSRWRQLAAMAAKLPETIKKDVAVHATRQDDWPALVKLSSEMLRYMEWRESEWQRQGALKELESSGNATDLQARLDEARRVQATLSCGILRESWSSRIIPRRAAAAAMVRRYFDLSARLRRAPDRAAWLALHNDFKTTCGEIARLFPVWIVTSLSIRRALPLTPAFFDTVVIDEASQCDIASAIPVLFRAKRATIIGDPHQLRHVSTLDPDREVEIAGDTGAAGFLADWSYVTKSLYDLAETVYIRQNQMPLLLDEHYRSHVDIIGFSNRVIYGDSLVIRTKSESLREKAGADGVGLFWHEVRGHVPHSLRSAVNEEEIQAIVDTLARWTEEGFLARTDIKVGVVTPFRKQMDRIEDAVQSQPWYQQVAGRVVVGTAHRFQGDEADVMLFSPVVSDGIPPSKARWVADTRQLLNVAVTRARAALHVFGNSDACRKAGGLLGDFAAYAANVDIYRRQDRYGSPAETELARLLTEAGLWFQPQHRSARCPRPLDFLVVSPMGTRYDVEVDGRQHWTDEQVQRDDIDDRAVESAGLRVIRIEARDVLTRPDAVRTMLTRLA